MTDHQGELTQVPAVEEAGFLSRAANLGYTAVERASNIMGNFMGRRPALAAAGGLALATAFGHAAPAAAEVMPLHAGGVTAETAHAHGPIQPSRLVTKGFHAWGSIYADATAAKIHPNHVLIKRNRVVLEGPCERTESRNTAKRIVIGSGLDKITGCYNYGNIKYPLSRLPYPEMQRPNWPSSLKIIGNEAARSALKYELPDVGKKNETFINGDATVMSATNKKAIIKYARIPDETDKNVIKSIRFVAGKSPVYTLYK